MNKRTFNEFLQELVDSGTDYWVETITREDALNILKTYRKLKAIETEIETYHKRENKASAWCTIELIEKILNSSYFTTKGEKDE